MHALQGWIFEYRRAIVIQGRVVDRRDVKEKYTALMMASRHNYFEIAKLLISEGGGAEVDLTDDSMGLLLYITHPCMVI